MKKYEIIPCERVGNIIFSQDRESVRAEINLPYREFKKNAYAKNTTDAYECFHVYYDENNRVCAVEFFEGIKLVLNGKKLFPGKMTSARKLIPDLEDDGTGFISRGLSIGITCSSDNPRKIECILVGNAGYYEEP